jgi:antitoxin component YwqK of YwqJK toxin-antitoxin module
MKKPILLFLFILLLANYLSAQEVIYKKGKYISRENGKPYTGIYKEFNTSNTLIAETSIKDGKLEGASAIYYPSGAKKEIRSYQAGLKHGTWTTWNEAGGKTAEANFKNGKKDGNWFVWDDNGINRYEMFYVNGEKKGTWIIRDENGKEISREDFK